MPRICLLPSSALAFLRRCRNRLRKEILFVRLGYPTCVLSGPFKGMQYILRSVGSALHPKVLGVYEMELHDAVEFMCDLPSDLIVNVGSGEGYYAVGLALRNPTASVVCVDPKAEARRLVLRLAERNGVASRIQVRERITAVDLNTLVDNARCPILIVDCEGREFDLLCPSRAPQLERCFMLVEVHTLYRERGVDELAARFSQSHHISAIRARRRTTVDMPPGVQFSPSEVDIIANEGRPPGMTWLMMIPKSWPAPIVGRRSAQGNGFTAPASAPARCASEARA